MAQPKLFDRVGSYWSGRKANGAEGLALLDECIRRVASKDRDWDALARFVSAANDSNNSAKVKKIIRAAFGNGLVFQLDKKHPAGGKFTMMWEGAFPLSQSNTYGLVKAAVAGGVSWDDKTFLKALGEVIPAPEKKAPTVDEKATAKAADHVVDYLMSKGADGFDLATIMRLVNAKLKGAAAKQATRKTVNGVDVIGPDL